MKLQNPAHRLANTGLPHTRQCAAVWAVRLCFALGALETLCVPAAFGNPAPAVAVSIRPLHSLVAGVMEGVGTPALIVRGAGSPHSYALRPSDARALSHARLVFWMGQDLELFLKQPLLSLAGGAKVVALSRAPGLRLLPAREGGMWEAHGEEHAEHARKPAVQAHAEINWHVWLSPPNATALVGAIVEALAETDPANSARYARNGAVLARRVAQLDAELRAQLAPVSRRPFVVLHDAYPYFEQHYGLNGVGSVTVDPGRMPGARRISQMRAKLKQLGTVCVFAEPQFSPRIVRTLSEGTDARTGMLDPLGVELQPGPGLFFALLRGMAQAFSDCLAP